MRNFARTLVAVAVAACFAVGGTGIATAADDPKIPPPAPVLTVMAASVGANTYAAVVDAVPNHVCKSDPAGVPVGAIDDYGQAIVGPLGLAAFTIPRSGDGAVTITCGPQFSEFSQTGTGSVIGAM